MAEKGTGMRKSYDARLHNNQHHERGDRVAPNVNGYAAATGLTDPAPSEDE